MITVAGIFEWNADAERAIRSLRAIGLTDEHLGLLAPGASDDAVEQTITHSEIEAGGVSEKFGGALGRGVGIAGGILVGGMIGSLFVPGVGSVIGAGMLATAIMGLLGRATGKAAGGEIDEAVVSHLRQDEIHIYEEALRSGRVVLIAMVADERQAESTRGLLLDAGAISLDEAHDTWWSGLRGAEDEDYARRGFDFAADEPLYRQGFEAAQHPLWRNKPYSQIAGELHECYGDDSRQDTFRRGYERGLSHHQRVVEKHSE